MRCTESCSKIKYESYIAEIIELLKIIALPSTFFVESDAYVYK